MNNFLSKRFNTSDFSTPSVLVQFLSVTIIGSICAILGGVSASAQPVSALSIVYIECVLNSKTTKGSGVVIDVDGRVLTSAHVVKDNAAQCKGAVATRSDPFAMKLMNVKHVGKFRDVALLQFVENAQITKLPIPYDGTDSIDESVAVVGYGYHPLKIGGPDTVNGMIKSGDRSGNGEIDAGVNTTPGMSGGPVLIDGKLIGIIASEKFDVLSQTVATQIVVVDEYPEEILRWLEKAVINVGIDRETILAEQLAANDVCTQILREQISVRADRFPRAAEIAASMIDEPSSRLTDEAEYWVTVTTGPAERADCRSGNMLKAMYFPMGMMVQPERDVIVAGETRTIFLTEHGLRLFLDKEAVAPISDDVGYIFSTANAAYKVCKRNDKDCDPFKEYAITDDDQDWPFISGYMSYLRSDNAIEIDTARTQLEALYEYQKAPFDPTVQVLDLSDPTSVDACAVRTAWLHTYFSHYDKSAFQAGSAYLYPVRFSLCTLAKGLANNRFERTKLVTHNYAEERFSQLWAVDTFRKPSDSMQRAARALFKVESPFAEIFKCGQPRDGVFTLGSISKAPINVVSDLIFDDIDRFSIFRQFQVAQAQSPIDIFKTAPLFNDIELSIVCAGQDEVENAGRIIIDLAPLSYGLNLELDLFDLFEELRKRFKNLGMVDEKILNKRLREGVMYRICEFHEYVAWRTVLFNEIKDREPVREAKDIMGVNLNLVADHITHLIMASVFSTDVRLRNADNRRQGCV